jgi:hypothetical protein
VAIPPTAVSASKTKSASGKLSVATHSWQLVIEVPASKSIEADID